MTKITIGIVGYGRFGALLETIVQEHCPSAQLKIFSLDQAIDKKTFFSLEDTCSVDYLVLAVPIRSLVACLEQVQHLVSEHTTVIDVCSVKQFPKDQMLTILPPGGTIICSHPMFGPSTYNSKRLKSAPPLKNLKIVVELARGSEQRFNTVKAFCEKLGLQVIEMDAAQHDQMAAHFHFVSLSAASILKPLQLQKTDISTASADVLVEFLDMISTSESLLVDMYQFNPFCKQYLTMMKNSISEYLRLFE
ncbi:MAG: prephenate dehydrogenase [Bdellovibrionales bacterium]|nr:prephenate dehydrogenase [Bdellovibrionales bacterium]